MYLFHFHGDKWYSWVMLYKVLWQPKRQTKEIKEEVFMKDNVEGIHFYQIDKAGGGICQTKDVAWNCCYHWTSSPSVLLACRPYVESTRKWVWKKTIACTWRALKDHTESFRLNIVGNRRVNDQVFSLRGIALAATQSWRLRVELLQ